MDEINSTINKLSKNAINAINLAYEYAFRNNSKFLDIKHLFIGIVNQKDSFIYRALESINFNSSITFDNIIDKEVEHNEEIHLSEDFKKVILESFYISRKMGHVYVGTEHLMLALLSLKNNQFVKELKNLGLDYETFQNLVYSFGNYPPGVFYHSDQSIETLKNLDYLGRTALSSMASNMNISSSKKEDISIVARDAELDRIIHILSRKNKNNPVLIGEAGVGKTSLVEYLAYKIYKKEVPEALQGYEIWNLDLSKLMMSTEMRGELESKINSIMEEIKSRGNIILFIDEIHMIFNLGSNSGNNDIANMLKPHLTSEYLRCIGATTLYEYQRFFENDTALNRRFLSVKINELSKENSIKAINKIKGSIEKYHNVKITDSAIEESVYLSDRFIVDRYLPDKAIDLLEESSTAKNLEEDSNTYKLRTLKSNLEKVVEKKERYLESQKYLQSLYYREKELEINNKIIQVNNNIGSRNKEITADDIVKVVSSSTGIPIFNISNSNLYSIKNLERDIKKEIIGQDNAVSRVVNILKSARAGFRDENRPLGIFLFVGPTGVGKTELAKQMALKYIGDKKSLIQIDMSEYMEAHSVSKFIGSPPGYVGYQEGGQLTEHIKNKPYSVVLFDEIEKAHPEVLNILLQVMEEGHLTDSRGRFINFKNTIIVLTSNIGSDIIENNSILGFNLDSDINLDKESQSELDNEYDKVEDETMIRLKDYLLPEFLNRIDDIIVFKSLNKNDALKITKKLSSEYGKKLLKNKVTLSFSDNYLKFIAKKGFSEEFGARQIKRIFNKYTETSLATFFIENSNMISGDKHMNLYLDINSESRVDIKIL
jgi:ATP-dependent Clp protease ATP-binding subunit ClpC